MSKCQRVTDISALNSPHPKTNSFAVDGTQSRCVRSVRMNRVDNVPCRYPGNTRCDSYSAISCGGISFVWKRRPSTVNVKYANTLETSRSSLGCSRKRSRRFRGYDRSRGHLIDYVAAGKESYAVVAAFNVFEYRHEAPLFL